MELIDSMTAALGIIMINIETIAITQRADVSKAPIALIDYVGHKR